MKYWLVMVLAGLSVSGFSAEPGIRIAWDYGTAAHITNGVYSRIHPIHNNEFAMVYSDGPDVWIRRSQDQCNSWSAPVLVDHEDGYNNTNAEIVRLANGWLLYAWNGRPLVENGLPYIIKTKISKDNGYSWEDERLIYTADNTFHNGCWEPVMMQLPSGEIQLYFANENPYRNSHEQEITLFRSFDNGLSWQDYTTVSFRAGSRDGMPVPLRLQDDQGLVFCIEDNGFNGNFKPVIIHSTEANNWENGPVTGADDRRWGALRADYALEGGVYAGAPYIIQLPSGQTLMSIQSSEGRISGDQANVQVYIGNGQAKDFSRRSSPLPWLPQDGNALWNALEVIDDQTVIVTSSVNTAGAGPGGIWQVKGKVIQPELVQHQTIVVDGVNDEWPDHKNIMIGSASRQKAHFQTAFDDEHLFILADVQDDDLWADSPGIAWDDDGFEVYLDVPNADCQGLCDGMKKLLINIGNGVLYDQVNNGGWTSWQDGNISYGLTINGTLNNSSDTDNGYVLEVAIPWTALGGQPEALSDWGIHCKLHGDTGGGTAELHEDLSGGDGNNASTYLSANLDIHGDGSGLTGYYYSGQQFDQFSNTRHDSVIQFNWGSGAPIAGLTEDDFSVQWKGYLQVPMSGWYTFYITSDNGRQLKIDNKMVIDAWVNDWDIEYDGQLYLEKGAMYPLELNYFEDFGGANIELSWSHERMEKRVISHEFLYPEQIITNTAMQSNVDGIVVLNQRLLLPDNCERITLYDLAGKLLGSIDDPGRTIALDQFSASTIIAVVEMNKGIIKRLVVSE